MHHTLSPIEPQPTPQLDPDLLTKAEQLKQTSLFVNPSDSSVLLDKQLIFLVLAGMKPMTEVESGHWVDVPGGREVQADDRREVESFLRSLGVYFRLSQDHYYTTALVSLDPQLLDEFARAETYPEPYIYEAVGRLFGYPETAVKAFAADLSLCMPSQEQDRIESKSKMLSSLLHFRLSRAHWRDELAVVKQWHKVLQNYGLAD